MPAAKLQGFGGMIPAIDPRLLPDDAAADSENVWYYNGTIQGLVAGQNVFTLVNPGVTNSVFRIPKISTRLTDWADSWWLEFSETDISIVKSPVAESADPAVYFASGVVPPGYNTLSRISTGQPNLVLGIPTPEVAPTVVPAGGASTVLETRAYVYTWLSAFFEEGPPSPPTVVTGKIDDTWAIGMTAPTVGDTTNRVLTYTNIYRTVTSSAGVATYYFVAQLPIATLTYNDTLADSSITSAGVLQSTNYLAPPTGLQGLTVMANGMMAGWLNNEIWFCEPYKPHAWPPQYQISTEFPIVAMAGVGQSLIVGTEGFPYFGTGVAPDQLALGRIPAPEPCISRGSMVTTEFGAYYGSPNGLVFLSAAGVAVNVTRNTISKQAWQSLLNLQELRAALLNGAYFVYAGVTEGAFEETAFEPTAFQTANDTGTRRGLLIEFQQQNVGITRLLSPISVFNVFTDIWTSEVLLVSDAAVFWMNLASLTQQAYTWTSKIFTLPYPTNLGAAKFTYDPPPDGSGSVSQLKVYAWNNGQPPFLWLTRSLPDSNQVFRLPSGFKADAYQFQVTGNLVIKSFQFADTVKALQSV